MTCCFVVQEFVVDRCEEMVVVDGVVPKSAAEEANIKKVSTTCACVRGDSGH